VIQLSAWNSGVSHKRVLPIEAKRFLCKYRIAERCDDYSILIPVSYTIVATCMLQPTFLIDIHWATSREARRLVTEVFF